MGALLISVQRRLETEAATSLVASAVTHQEPVRAFHQPLRSIRRRSAPDADRKRFRDVFRDCEQLRHWIKRPAAEVLVETCDDDALSHVGQPVAHEDEFEIEELPLVDSDHLGASVNRIDDFPGLPDKLRLDLHVAVTDDMIFAVPVVQSGFEDLHTLPADLRAPKPADQFLTFSAEHTAANYFDPTQTVAAMLKLLAHLVAIISCNG